MSHRAEVKVEFRDPAAFEAAVRACGFEYVGQGTHKLWTYTADGIGFKPPGWRYPAVLAADGQLVFDDSSRAGFGKTYVDGRVPEVDQLTGRYALEAALLAAKAQGWYGEIQGDTLTIYAGDQGMLTVTTDGVIDASQFAGTSCVGPVETLAAALGQTVSSQAKPEQAMVMQAQYVTE